MFSDSAKPCRVFRKRMKSSTSRCPVSGKDQRATVRNQTRSVCSSIHPERSPCLEYQRASGTEECGERSAHDGARSLLHFPGSRGEPGVKVRLEIEGYTGRGVGLAGPAPHRLKDSETRFDQFHVQRSATVRHVNPREPPAPFSPPEGMDAHGAAAFGEPPLDEVPGGNSARVPGLVAANAEQLRRRNVRQPKSFSHRDTATDVHAGIDGVPINDFDQHRRVVPQHGEPVRIIPRPEHAHPLTIFAPGDRGDYIAADREGTLRLEEVEFAQGADVKSKIKLDFAPVGRKMTGNPAEVGKVIH